MCRVTDCCCCGSLEGGCKAIAITGIILGALGALGGGSQDPIAAVVNLLWLVSR